MATAAIAAIAKSAIELHWWVHSCIEIMHYCISLSTALLATAETNSVLCKTDCWKLLTALMHWSLVLVWCMESRTDGWSIGSGTELLKAAAMLYIGQAERDAQMTK